MSNQEIEKIWAIKIREYKGFLRIEKSLSKNSVDAYILDIDKLKQFVEINKLEKEPEHVSLDELKQFVKWINEIGLGTRSQARIISGIKSFYRYLVLVDDIDDDPSMLLEAPKIGRKLPEVLSIHEIDKLIAAIDLSKPEGHRNKAIVETLYSCGLRVSELINLKITNLYFDEGFIKIIGKGNKERLVPIGKSAIDNISLYMNQSRKNLPRIAPESENTVFLNRRGRILTREMIFIIIKQLAKIAEIKKQVSPHTLRHSFATHLVDGGADLRAVQDMLGHQSILTTEIYTHLDQDYLRSTIIEHHPRSPKNIKKTKEDNIS